MLAQYNRLQSNPWFALRELNVAPPSGQTIARITIRLAGAYMGVFLSSDELHRILCLRFEGIITDDVLLSSFDRVREWMHGNGLRSSITDFTGVESFQVTASAVNQLAAKRPLVPDGFLRIVVAPQDEIFGMTRMFEMLGSKTRDRVDVVRTVAEAYTLAGVESLNLRPVMDW